jgi:hypothetical protein
MYKNNVEIVISRYNEDLSWINEYPFNQFEYIVYNKGDNDNFEKNNVKKIINLDNVGRCDHTYLYHIINNYDNLSEHTIFLPGSSNMITKYTKAKKYNLCKKALEDRISVIVDGDCHTDKLREPYIALATATRSLVLHIEVNPGIGMAYIFNHVMVENSTDENIVLYSDKEYHIYQSTVKRPEKTVLYCPVIKQTPQIMEYRY